MWAICEKEKENQMERILPLLKIKRLNNVDWVKIQNDVDDDKNNTKKLKTS